MYLNIILTLLFLVIACNGFIFSLLLALMRKEGVVGKDEIDARREYQKKTNDYMIMLHEEMIRELKKISGGNE